MPSNIGRVPANGSSESHKAGTESNNRIGSAASRSLRSNSTADRRISQDAAADLIAALLAEARPGPRGEFPSHPEVVASGVAARNVERLWSEAKDLLKTGGDPELAFDGIDKHFPGNQTYTMEVNIPKFYNPDSHGVRRPIEEAKRDITLEEVKQIFGGYTRSNVDGWAQGEGEDEHVRFEIDSVFHRKLKAVCKLWNETLESRFDQEWVYSKFWAVWFLSKKAKP